MRESPALATGFAGSLYFIFWALAEHLGGRLDSAVIQKEIAIRPCELSRHSLDFTVVKSYGAAVSVQLVLDNELGC